MIFNYRLELVSIKLPKTTATVVLDLRNTEMVISKCNICSTK